MVIGSTLRRGAPRCWTVKLYSLIRVTNSIQDPHHGVIMLLLSCSSLRKSPILVDISSMLWSSREFRVVMRLSRGEPSPFPLEDIASRERGKRGSRVKDSTS